MACSLESAGGVDVVDEEGDQIYQWTEPGSPSESDPENPDDVVHCICGSTVDEGFMIQVCMLSGHLRVVTPSPIDARRGSTV